jgi:hypothetical protein
MQFSPIRYDSGTQTSYSLLITLANSSSLIDFHSFFKIVATRPTYRDGEGDSNNIPTWQRTDLLVSHNGAAPTDISLYSSENNSSISSVSSSDVEEFYLLGYNAV